MQLFQKQVHLFILLQNLAQKNFQTMMFLCVLQFPLLVVFKTHLDIGFTDLSSKVEQRYVESFIPQAIDVARSLREAGGEERYVWTTGAWLIDAYLRQASPAAVAELEREYILQRQKEGIALAKQEGKYKGRKPIDRTALQPVLEEYRKGNLTATQAMRKMGVSKSTFYRLIETR